jgi:cytidylate kinase
MIIAVDGPAGAGKSTVAKILAKKLGFLYIDTGSMYRALTIKVLDNHIDINDIDSIVVLAEKTRIDLAVNPDGSFKVFLDDRDVSLAIREPRITEFVSDIAKIKGVREIMVRLQRRFGHEKDSVLDGRDIGTVVFPDAQKKFFIDAGFQERVNRRFKDLKNLKIEGVSKEQVAADLKNRDTIDSTREVAPLKKADDAIYIDTTDMTIDEVVDCMLTNIKNNK